MTPTSGGNKSHERAIDTDSVAIRATKQQLTPTSVPAFLPTALLQAIIQSPIQDARQAVSAACIKNIKHLSQQNTISGGNKRHSLVPDTLPSPAYSIPLDMLCSQTMCQPKLILCAFTNSKRGSALKAGVLIVMYSHVLQALGNVGPRKL